MMPSPLVSARQLFNIDSDLLVPQLATRDEHVPEIDTAYQFNTEVTLAILAGFMHNRRVQYEWSVPRHAHVEPRPA
jgi:cobaltochelatase CobS